MSEFEIKVRAAILAMRVKLKTLNHEYSDDICIAIKAEGYKSAIDDLLKYLEL